MSTNIYKGSCLCGAIRYELTGEPGNFYHCHCSRCRKATGTGHASNLFVTTDGIRWSGDEGLLKSYKVPDARFFSTTFCTACGGKLPRFIERARMAVVPAGSLDSEIETTPTARIFWESRSRWSCDGADDIERHPEFPPQ